MDIQCDVIILTECWLSKIANIPALDGYISYKSQFSNQNDGVILYVKSTISHTIAEPTLQDANCLILRVDSTIAVIAAYRSPSSRNIDSFIDSLDLVLASLVQYKTVILTGDLNINILSNDVTTDSYLNILASHGLLAAHTIPTRDKACLDHVMVRSNKGSTTVILDSPITDHFPTIFCSEVNFQHCAVKKIVSRINIPAVVEQLSRTDFFPILTATDANAAASDLVNAIANVVSANTILIKIPNRKRCLKPWITPGLLRCIKNRDNLHKKAKASPNNEVLHVTYTRYRNFCNNLLKKLKAEFESKELNNNKDNTKGLWKVIKNITHLNKSSTPPLELLKLTNNDTDSVDQVNNFFANIGADLASRIQNDSTNRRQFSQSNNKYSSMALLDTDETEVENIILGLKNNCAIGVDGISNEILKSARHILVQPITFLCNLCLSSGVFPDVFKGALVSPIHKGGDRHSVTNYRPISILTSLSKVLEKILNTRLVDYLDTNNIIANNQYGFRKSLSTEHAVLELTERIVGLLDNKAKVIGIFLDLTKAFDTVSIPLLLDKMEGLGIRGIVLDIFRSYLFNRKQRVKVGNVMSNNASPTFGVPQGSVLGPTLFLIYINNLCLIDIPNCSLISYADDTVLIAHGTDWEQARHKAENAVATVMTWLNQNLLTLNILKTKFITFSPRTQSQPAIGAIDVVAHACHSSTSDCNCLTLTRANNIKYLGVIIDSTFSWHDHISSLVGRIRKLLPIFKKLRTCADLKTLHIVYSALTQSLLQYCITAWGGSGTTFMLRLERAQRAILKVMLGKPRRYSTNTLYEECKLLTVRQLYVLRSITMLHPCLHFNPIAGRRRMWSCPSVPHRTSLARRQYFVSAPRLYNKVNKIHNIYALPLNRCKNVIKSWLLTLTYHDTEALI